MKILFVLENYLPHIGGVEIIFKNLCEGLTKLGHDISIVTHRLKGTKKFEVINGVKIHRVRCFDSRYLFTFFAIPKVLKLSKKTDIIHTTTFNGAPPAWLAAKINKKPCLLTVHEVWVNKWKSITQIGNISAFAHNLLEKCIYLLNYTHYACVSKSTQSDLLKLNIKKQKTNIIYNSIDYSHWNPDNYNGNKIRKKLNIEKNFVYLFTGRPGISKGLEYLIKAVPEISKKIPNAKLLAIVSRDKSYEKRYLYILKLIKKLKIQDKIILHHSVSYKDLPNYVNASDCVVIPSLAEGFGFAAAEACAMNKSVVASNTTSLPEVVSGKFVLVKPKSPKAIAKGVELAFKNKTKKSKLKRFELKTNLNKYIKVYKSLLK